MSDKTFIRTTAVYEAERDEALAAATELADELDMACRPVYVTPTGLRLDPPAYVDPSGLVLLASSNPADLAEILRLRRIIAGGTEDGVYEPRMLGLTRAEVADLKTQVKAWRNDAKVWQFRAKKAEGERDEARAEVERLLCPFCGRRYVHADRSA